MLIKSTAQTQIKKSRLVLKILFVFPLLALLVGIFFVFAPYHLLGPTLDNNPVLGDVLLLREKVFNKLCSRFPAIFYKELAPFSDIERITLVTDKNANGIFDLDEFVLAAREEANQKPLYRSAYYQGGYPPDTEGVCSDVIWRAMKPAGYNLKELIDADIKANLAAYPRVRQGGGKPDPNIDFRRVPNLDVFFQRYGTTLANEIIPGNRENLKLWQGGDIVVFYNPDHIGIVSDRRNYQGVPLLIHNDGPWTSESDDLLKWKQLSKKMKHYRYPVQD